MEANGWHEEGVLGDGMRGRDVTAAPCGRDAL